MKISIRLLFLFFLALAPLKAFTIEISNDFLKIFMDNLDDRFIISTTGGDPATKLDDNKLLMYSGFVKSDRHTSFTTIRIDNEDYIFGDSNGVSVSNPRISGNEILAVWKTRGVEITQRLAFANGPNTGRMDNVLIEYTLKNVTESNKAHRVGLRILFDTLLGANDGVPFTIPGTGKVTTEMRIKKENMPDYIYVLEKIVNPSVLAQCYLKLPDSPLPDKVLLMNWGKMYNNPWNVDVQVGKGFSSFLGIGTDSAMGIYWYPDELAPGQSVKFAVLYGIYGVELIDTNKIFNVAVSAPKETQPNESFTISCDIENNSSINTLYNVKASVVLPGENNLLCNSDEITEPLGNLKPKHSAATSWTLIPKLVNDIYEINYFIEITGNIETAKETVPKTVRIAKTIDIKKLELKLSDYGLETINEALRNVNNGIKKNLLVIEKLELEMPKAN